MRRKLLLTSLLIFTFSGCATPSTAAPGNTQIPIDTRPALTNTITLPSPTETAPATATNAVTETPTAPPSRTPIPTVESLEASVTANLLSCRYGPGPEYLYLFALRAGANVDLIGRVDAQNWNWVLVENQVPCWVHANFLSVQGEIKSLPIVYPGTARLPITPYYPASTVLSAKRNVPTHEITVSWVDVPVSLGDYEDESMQTYIIEVWRCQGGELIFDPLATRVAFTTFVDEPGCSEPSHGRVWVQEKHGYAGPAEIPWPAHSAP